MSTLLRAGYSVKLKKTFPRVGIESTTTKLNTVVVNETHP